MTHRQFINLYEKYSGGNKEGKEVKLKTAEELQAVLDATKEVIASLSDSGTDDDNYSHSKLIQVRDVLMRGGHFSGINRKVQFKPIMFETAPPSPPTISTGSEDQKTTTTTTTTRVSEILLVLKWGGELTHGGVVQAIRLSFSFPLLSSLTSLTHRLYNILRYGQSFRNIMYSSMEGDGGGLLRLHSTYR